VAYSPDGRRLAFGDDRTVRVCDAATGNEAFALGKHSWPVTSVVFGPDGRWLASADVGGAVKIWGAASRQENLTVQHAARVTALAASPDGRRLAAAADDRVVKIWDVASGQEALTLRGHTDVVWCVAYSPEGWRLASCGGDGAVKIWDATTPADALTLSSAPTILDLAFSPDDRRLAVVNSGTAVRIYDTVTTQEVVTLYGHGANVQAVAYSRDDRLASGGDDRTVRLWDAANGAELSCLRGHSGPVVCVAFSPDGRLLASASPCRKVAGRLVPGEVRIWGAATGEALGTLPRSAELAVPAAFAGLAFSPDGGQLAATEGRTVRVWEVATRRPLLTLSGHEDVVTQVAYSPDGRQLATASRDRSVRSWDTSTGENVLALRGHTTGVSGLAFSPDGRRLASAAAAPSQGGRMRAEVKLWDTLTGQEILSLSGAPAQFSRVAFTRDGRRLAATGDSVVTAWVTTPPDELSQAVSLVQFLLAKSSAQAEVLNHLRNDATLGDGLRQRALDLVEPLWQGRVRAEAEDKVRLLFAKPLLRAEVLEQLRADSSLSPPVRQTALALAERYVGGPTWPYEAARAGARRPGAAPDTYRRALRFAETLCRRLPFEGTYRTTLGVLQYRLGQHPEALATLTQAAGLNEAERGGPVPADLAFLAMTRYQLGEKEQARALLGRLRETMQKPNWRGNEEGQDFLKEAEALLAGPPAPRR
jgi:WD40 repeat protein